MKTVLLMRHAKASPSPPGVADFDRPLLAEGRIAAALVGEFLKREQFTIDEAISSPAVRARETIESVLLAAGMSLKVHADQRLYEGGALLLLEVLSEVDDDVETVLLVGHNPVLEDFMQHLTGESVHLSPATLTHVDSEAEKWSEIHTAKHKLRRVVRAKDLE
ncbi:MAG: SixA phosphatase family protein [Pyrinomonadaceae bacterium]